MWCELYLELRQYSWAVYSNTPFGFHGCRKLWERDEMRRFWEPVNFGLDGGLLCEMGRSVMKSKKLWVLAEVQGDLQQEVGDWVSQDRTRLHKLLNVLTHGRAWVASLDHFRGFPLQKGCQMSETEIGESKVHAKLWGQADIAYSWAGSFSLHSGLGCITWQIAGGIFQFSNLTNNLLSMSFLKTCQKS